MDTENKRIDGRPTFDISAWPEGKSIPAPRFAKALLDGINGVPEDGELRETIWRWVARQIEAWERDVREEERSKMNNACTGSVIHQEYMYCPVHDSK